MAIRRTVRRYRATPSGSDPLSEVRKRADKILSVIEALEAEKTKAEAAIADRVAELEQTLTKAGIESHEFGDWAAYVKEQKTNATREVDPLKLYNKLSEKDFFACVKVSLTELAQVMTESEINAIAKVTPSKVKGKKFVVERKAKKAKGRN